VVTGFLMTLSSQQILKVNLGFLLPLKARLFFSGTGTASQVLSSGVLIALKVDSNIGPHAIDQKKAATCRQSTGVEGHDRDLRTEHVMEKTGW
jgi:hypothetical protein